MNSSNLYSCSDNTGLSHNSVTPDYWDIRTDTRDTALTSAVLTLFFILVGVPSNVLIIVSILTQKLYRQPTFILLLNLATSNFLICASFMPFTVVSGLAGAFIFGSTDIARCRACQFAAVCLTFFGLLTVHFLSLLSLDRFVFIKYPLKYHYLVTTRRITIACSSLWILCIALSILPLFGFGDIMFDLRPAVCALDPDGSNRVTKNIYYFVFIALEMCFPLGLLVVTNACILHIAHKQMRRIHSIRRNLQVDKETFKEKVKAKIKSSKFLKQLQLVKVFGAILIANIVTWTPMFIRVIGTAIFGDIFSKWFHVFIFVSVISFAIVHPVIEASLIPELRKKYTKYVKVPVCLRCTLKSHSIANVFSCETLALKCRKKKCPLDCLEFLEASFISNMDDLVSDDEVSV